MAAPLINAVAPAIDFIISKIVSLINMLGALFAVITGAGSFTQAKKQAVSYGEALGGAAKELQDYVLGIDELNVIKDNAGGGVRKLPSRPGLRQLLRLCRCGNPCGAELEPAKIHLRIGPPDGP